MDLKRVCSDEPSELVALAVRRYFLGVVAEHGLGCRPFAGIGAAGLPGRRRANESGVEAQVVHGLKPRGLEVLR